MLNGKQVLLVISGGIAAYKCPDLVRALRKRGASVRCVLTAGGAQFVTPLALGAVSEEKVYEELFSLTDEAEMGHIRLSRESDVVLVAPATANILAKMASGIADDLATTALLATDKPVICAPAMNVRMWESPATANNIKTLSERGVSFIGPEEGDMACGEWGEGRMSEPDQIVEALENFFRRGMPLDGTRALVTSGPTYEAIDPVRYLANRSSGKQGHAIAAALAGLGSVTTLVSGPTHQPDPAGVEVIRVESAAQMFDACHHALPVDVAVLAAAVSDWRPEQTPTGKIKKIPGAGPPGLSLVENPDILASLSAPGNARPRLV
ncbi:MAG: bifunctional phosphopantothenoylcysteine decarboxylase/phosphopantothenate--cysteine ligase CoaBC, partial [Alphaproteobacteria bacterium]|nr:bifunctional phosphopantothenoylcysteine decarboxylase/phosphopantothenate--cysteine ligase CoaBC [Alphaproteobacteria bacterium]